MTKTKLILDANTPVFQINELGPITEGKIDIQMTIKNHNTRSETVRLGFRVESADGPVYSSYQSPEIPKGLFELRPGELRKLRLRQDNLKLTPTNNVLWFDVRSAGQPAKSIFLTRLMKFESAQGPAAGTTSK